MAKKCWTYLLGNYYASSESEVGSSIFVMKNFAYILYFKAMCICSCVHEILLGILLQNYQNDLLANIKKLGKPIDDSKLISC